MLNRTSLLLFFACIVQVYPVAGQQEKRPKPIIGGYPVLFYLPETRVGFGLAGIGAWQLQRGDTISPLSTIQAGFAYTQEKQILSYLPFDLYWDGRKHQVNGELGYYRYFYYFFGAGAIAPDDHRETYSTRFPRFRIHYLRRLWPSWYAGVRWWHEDHHIYKTEAGGLLDQGVIRGARGGASGGPGVVLLYDTRDHVLATRSGMSVELSWHHQGTSTFSDFSFDRYRVDARRFFPLGKKGTVGGMVFSEVIRGDVPFFSMSSIGSQKRMRGYYEGRYRDRSQLLLQAEWRSFVYRRWGIGVFVNQALLANDPSGWALNNSLFSAGGGVRFAVDPERRLHLRLDYAAGRRSDAWYFTVGEAF